MVLMKIMKPDFEFTDDRGKIVQLVREGYKQVNVITSHAGVLRGSHYHKLNHEAFYLPYGKCRATAEDKDGNKEVRVFVAGEMFGIEPYIMHNFEYLDESMMVSFYDKGVELGEGVMDVYTEF